MYKPSMFNFVLDEGADIILFNSVSGLSNTCRVKGKYVKEIKDILSQNKCRQSDKDSILFSTLIDKGFIVVADCDERQKREALFTQINANKMLRLIILPTEQCNYRCKYCYESFKKGKMKLEVQNAIIKFVQKNLHYYSGIRLSWFGGEPLLAMDIIETLSTKIMEICKRTKRKYISDITTNGYLLDLDAFRKLLEWNVVEYQITIDGIKEIHDSKKPLVNGEGTFDIVTKNLKDIKDNIKSSAFSIIIRSNVTDDAVTSMDEFTDFFYDLIGDDKRFSFFLRPAGDWGGENRLDEMTQNRIEEQDISIVYENFYKTCHPFKINTHQSFYALGGCMCYASFLDSYVIDSLGNLRKCTCELDDDQYCIGHLNEAGVMDIDYNKHVQWIGNTVRFSEKCDMCNFSPLCFGACCPLHNIFECHNGQHQIICPSEKEHILDTLKFIEKTTPFFEINDSMAHDMEVHLR